MCTATDVAVVSITLYQLHGPASYDLSRAVRQPPFLHR